MTLCKGTMGTAPHDLDAVGQRKGGRCKACRSEASARCYSANPEKAKARAARYRAANLEQVRERKARHRAANPEKVREDGARYRAANAEKVRERNRLRDARKRDRVSWDVRLIAPMLKALTGDLCTYCGLPFAGPTTADHVLPVAEGGAVHAPDYLVPCCGSCNSSRRHRPLLEWLRERHGWAGYVRLREWEAKRDAWLRIRRFIEGGSDGDGGERVAA